MSLNIISQLYQNQGGKEHDDNIRVWKFSVSNHFCCPVTDRQTLYIYYSVCILAFTADSLEGFIVLHRMLDVYYVYCFMQDLGRLCCLRDMPTWAVFRVIVIITVIRKPISRTPYHETVPSIYRRV